MTTRILLSIALATGLLISTSTVAEARTGVALVHGTGNQTNAASDYWTWDEVNSIRSGLPNTSDYVVVNCNFTQYMWTSGAAGCLAGQLSNFISSHGITDLVVVTHSNGGNVMRWIMSNPTWDSRYPGIIDATRYVIALAPSSLGTPLANAVISGSIFEAALGWLLGYINDAVRMQQTDWMPYYNGSWLYGTNNRPTLPKGFYNVTGTDVESSPFDSDSYCGGYTNQVGLEISQEWLSSCSDGFLDCSSQEGAGSLWFRDTSYTKGGEPLSHAQSRRDCFYMDQFIRNIL